MFTSLKISTLLYTALSLITLSTCSFKERIHMEENNIYVKYEHQLKDGSTSFQQTVDASSLYNRTPVSCSNNIDNVYCLQWGSLARFRITTINDNCEDYVYNTVLDLPLTVTFNITNIHLYGGPEQSVQTWPFDVLTFDKHLFISKKNDSQAVLESYWLTSSGFYLYVDDETPLFITLHRDEDIFRIIASREYPYVRDSTTYLKYRVCKFENMRIAHEHAIANVLGKPTDVPDFRMVQFPIWSTWAKYKTNVSEKVVLEFANDILKYGLPNSQLEIDDNWETCYGSLTPDKEKFPNMKNLVTKLKNLGFRVTVWVHPFVNLDCQQYHSQGAKNGFFIKSINGSINTVWWNGDASHIDFTNPGAVDWYQERLRKLQVETGIDSFKFDAGESDWTPLPVNLYEMRLDNPETNLKAYIKAVSEFGDMIEVRSARGTQQYPIFVRMIDRETKWTGPVGLSTMIPELLHMNMVGYPFVLPDMIGGNGYNGDIVTDEMFVRWLQINVFMPSLQFSYPPWEFGEKVVESTKKFVNLHSKYSKKIREAMIQAAKTGAPVNPPLWWIDPTDPVTHTIDSEFLLGEDILVAPVVEEGAKSRNIYLPSGLWKDEVNETADIIWGPVWLKNYPADLDVLPYFSRIESSATCLAPILLLIIPTLIIIFFK